ncbi:MAG TPA: GNAT family N-acyltransferase [Blastocatellia bacterium]|jgi:L-ornithine Nalpha-acyltransferase
MLATIQTQQLQPIRAGKLEVRLATTLAELDAAMRLRFEVFNLELQEGLQSSYARGYDTDAYDAYCDHLIVKDLELDEVVGTYRLLRQAQAERNIGFYSENEFDLSNLKRAAKINGGELLELGRSCIAGSHRSFATINLLWGAIASHAVERGIRYLFGCGSLHVSNIEEVRQIYSYLRAHHFAPETYRVYPLEHCRMEVEQEISEPFEPRTLQRKLSPILKGYLRTGALICGAPAYDAEFGTADVLVLVEMEKLSQRYKQHYVAETKPAGGLR